MENREYMEEYINDIILTIYDILLQFNNTAMRTRELAHILMSGDLANHVNSAIDKLQELSKTVEEKVVDIYRDVCVAKSIIEHKSLDEAQELCNR